MHLMSLFVILIEILSDKITVAKGYGYLKDECFPSKFGYNVLNKEVSDTKCVFWDWRSANS